jgi:thiamine-phosphate pyrophosphorylase
MGDRLFQPALYRILDANLDRVREGLRIIEEWCRFGLNQADLVETCKNLRQETARWHHPKLRSARNTAEDPGTGLTHPQEAERSNLQQVLQANFCRVQEALRVLEEYGKLYDGSMAASFKQMRYQVYRLESQLLAHDRYQKLLEAKLYLVTSPSENLVEIVDAALEGGLRLVQYRDKGVDDVTRISRAQQLCELCHSYGALFIVNDRVDVAVAVNADGVHLGQQDVPIALARQVLGPNRIVGRSTTNLDEMRRALEEGADYIGVGPVYETPTKPGKAAAGLEYVAFAAKHASIPWFAIGSITPNNLRDVMEAGATRVAVVRSIMQAEQPTLVTQYFLSQLQRGTR